MHTYGSICKFLSSLPQSASTICMMFESRLMILRLSFTSSEMNLMKYGNSGGSVVSLRSVLTTALTNSGSEERIASLTISKNNCCSFDSVVSLSFSVFSTNPFEDGFCGIAGCTPSTASQCAVSVTSCGSGGSFDCTRSRMTISSSCVKCDKLSASL